MKAEKVKSPRAGRSAFSNWHWCFRVNWNVPIESWLSLAEMLELKIDNYRVVYSDDPTYESGSADNVHSYHREYMLREDGDETGLVSGHALRVYEDEELIASCILQAEGGPTGVHDQSAIIRKGSCVVAIGSFVVSLHIPTLELEWATQTDLATCFGVYFSESRDCIISHGEIEIARLSQDGEIVWSSSGADIFTNGITISDDYVRVVDFYDREYKFNIGNGHACEV